MKCAITSRTARAGAAIAVAAAAGILVAIPAAAASTININQDLPTAPVQATVGDVIDFTLPAVNVEPPQGFSGGASTFEYAMLSSSDSGVLPKVNGAYDANGTLHEEFSAAKAGTATITVISPVGGRFCKTTTSTSSSSTSTSTSSSTSTLSTPDAASECLVVDPLPPRVVTVVVSSTHVEGVVDVPPTGSGGSSTVGLGIALLGVMVTCVGVVAGRDELRRRR